MTKAELKSLWYIKRKLAQDETIDEHERVRLEKKVERIEEWIDNIEDPLVRDVVVYRFKHGYRWAKVAVLIGGGNTEDAVRMIVTRYLRK